MDDMILAGALSIAALYLGAGLVIVAAFVLLAEIAGAVFAGDSARAGILLATALLTAGAYTGTGLFLQKTGRI
ncbi:MULTISPECIES: hypothetical protein [unclassified Methanoregula]|uniref:hypothetical protein n=1 Tax=unclassified Methanoregula TaxID=2649730 RepID=UPI0009CD188B|nr:MULTISPECIES: hypothetical protein [unclassified Methanoregula]OPX63931.1 MAG: hypothetical protein A4E33_01461 [Methanoregula sp. PtaB.Bin085]OPY35483.1 MAG: hypothetical protein A4E34_00758 [Methanoregula sp. PtaU1.Bin006]